jgi:hypothetical protein
MIAYWAVVSMPGTVKQLFAGPVQNAAQLAQSKHVAHGMKGRDMNAARTMAMMLLPLLLAACAAQVPQHRDIVTLRAGEAPVDGAFPAPGTVWRLDQSDLAALSPAPSVEAPPPPRLPPPPRPNDPPQMYYAPPYYAPYFYWGPSFHYWRRR